MPELYGIGAIATSIGPFDSSNRALGGNKFVLFNAEYYFDIAAPLRFLLFYDAGEAYLEGQGLYWKTFRTSTGETSRRRMRSTKSVSGVCDGSGSIDSTNLNQCGLSKPQWRSDFERGHKEHE